MRRWVGPTLAMAATSLWLTRFHASNPAMLQDSDTAFLLGRLRQFPEPFRWFAGDWPLGNHFYRPISTAFFQLDEQIHPGSAAGFGWTNWALVLATLWALFWFVAEFTDDRFLTVSTVLLTAGWTTGAAFGPLRYVQWIPWVILIGGVARHKLDWKRWLVPTLAAWFAVGCLNGPEQALGLTFDWIPARTATSCAAFAFIALAAFARTMRARGRAESPATPLDLPATKSSKVATRVRDGSPWPWDVLAVVCGALALGAYEQAVMLPLTFALVALSFQWRGFPARWWPVVAQFGVLAAYIAIRLALVPTSASGYQRQQFRHSVSAARSLVEFLFPTLNDLPRMYIELMTMGWLAAFYATVWVGIWGLCANTVALARLRDRWRLAAPAALLAPLAFGPMAFLKPFGHYYFWPTGFYALFVAILVVSAYEGAVSAWSPRPLQAPPRRRPAPGSLPRP